MIKPAEIQNPNKLANPYKGKSPAAKPPVDGAGPASTASAANPANPPGSAVADPASKVELSDAAKQKAAEAKSGSSSSESTLSKLKDKIKKSKVSDAPIPTPDLPKASAKTEEGKKAGKTEEKENKRLWKKPAIVFVPGVEFFSESGSSASYDGIRKMAESVNGARIYGWDQDDEIIEHIKKFDKDQPVILVGHSFGGDTVHEVAEDLNTLEHGFRKVDLLVTLDSIGYGNDVIPSNVKRNLNIFSEKDLLFNDGPHVAREFNKTKVMNILRPEKHTDLDDTREVQKEIIDAIGDILKGFGREKTADSVVAKVVNTSDGSEAAEAESSELATSAPLNKSSDVNEPSRESK